MSSPTDEITASIKEGLVSFKDSIIGFINQMISSIASGFEVEFVFLISVILGIVITRWQKPKKIYLYGSIVNLLIFFSLRFLQIGN